MNRPLRYYTLLFVLPVLLAQTAMTDAEPVAPRLLFFNTLPWQVQPYTNGSETLPVTTTSIPGPLSMRAPLWITIDQVPAGRWHPPLLTPAVARAAQQAREAQRARRMADRAFYFGIDADNDALK
ncbi:hypothetical protein [Mariprofundus ferrooxydans]|uniref:Uncharacterized protein n=1 Tax=Mariprofundus ferrooxydans PV-1 TaxID=314345 RepID=Q0F2U1_9PROT|nr:hypothetical protein [Mariprofundus ferrooxydans]EAU56200.1 hypothetical protein SPV1_05248 [Mariprofundus ferrooxydans PV-1]KON48039.1 hypothetical protein AL013_04610 [Mariprofundus ferrooxydans]